MADISVIGAGTMGNGIAQVFAQNGHSVHLIEMLPAQLERAVGNIRRGLGRLVEKGRMSQEDMDAVLGRIRPASDLAEARSSELVVEAVFEQLDAKLEIFRTLDRVCIPDTVLASNTSSISITALASATRRPEKVVGMHFFNPAPVMKLVEIVSGLHTSGSTREYVTALAASMGKEPVAVRDFPGFVSNRVLLPMINEAVFSLYEGIADRDAIDTVMKLGMNHPMGPLELADLVGLDVCVHILDVLYQGFGDPKYRACPLLRQMVAAGKLGRKTGSGFYDYDS